MTRLFRNLKNSALTNFAEFRRDTRGAAAVEFVFIAPLLITLWLGTMEISQGIEVNKKVGRSAATIADLLAQTTVPLTPDVIDDIMAIGKSGLLPYNRDKPIITATAISIDEDKKATVAWSHDNQGGESAPYAAGSDVEVPPNLLIASTFLIKVETALEYRPVTTWSIDKNKSDADGAYASIDMKEAYFLRPRVLATIDCTGC